MNRYVIPARFQPYLNELRYRLAKKLGPRRNQVVIRIEIDQDFKNYLQRRYNIGWRWEPTGGAEHQQFLREANLHIKRVAAALGVPYEIAVAQFKTSGSPPFDFEIDIDGQRDRLTLESEVCFLSMRFTSEESN